METLTTHTATNAYQTYFLPIHELIDEGEQLVQNYWAENPDLYHLVQLNKQLALTTTVDLPKAEPETKTQANNNVVPSHTGPSLLSGTLRGATLRNRIRQSHQNIRLQTLAMNADISPRTQAHNRKCAHQTLEEARASRADIVAAQIRSWRSMLPTLIRRFSKIRDYRRPGAIKHKITVLMMFGLFAFVFRLSSRREMNRELTGPVIFEHLKRLFPELDSIPHADTLARLLTHINPKTIEAIYISLIKDLITKKKFKKLFPLFKNNFFHGCVVHNAIGNGDT